MKDRLYKWLGKSAYIDYSNCNYIQRLLFPFIIFYISVEFIPWFFLTLMYFIFIWFIYSIYLNVWKEMYDDVWPNYY